MADTMERFDFPSFMFGAVIATVGMAAYVLVIGNSFELRKDQWSCTATIEHPDPFRLGMEACTRWDRRPDPSK